MLEKRNKNREKMNRREKLKKSTSRVPSSPLFSEDDMIQEWDNEFENIIDNIFIQIQFYQVYLFKLTEDQGSNCPMGPNSYLPH